MGGVPSIYQHDPNIQLDPSEMQPDPSEMQPDPSESHNFQYPTEQIKIFKLWVGDKNSKNLPGAEVFVDGVSKGITDSNGEVRTEVSFGQHIISARAECGEASRSYEFNEGIDGVSLTIDSCPAVQAKVFKLWVGDKNSKNLPGAEVFVDGVSKGITDSNGEVRTEVSFGQHIISARAECGEASRSYEFNEGIDGVSLTIDSCPNTDKPPASESEIVFEGTTINFIEGTMPGAPDYWTVSVDKIISGSQPCTTPIDVVIRQSISPPIWGYVDESIEAGDKVVVYGSYITDDKGCRVTLHGLESFYFKKAACSGIVRGHVRDAQTNQPIKGASLECGLYCNGPITTNDQGYYELGSPACNICGLVYCSVTCNADGFEQRVQSLVTDVNGNGKNDLDFYLQPEKISIIVIQGEVIETPHCSPAGSQPDHYVKVRIKKVVQNPNNAQEIVPGSIITVRGNECSSVNDLVKGRCYEFHGEWRENALWVIFSNIKRIDCTSNDTATCGEILKYNISNGRYMAGQIILADMEYRSYLNRETDFQGVLLLRSSKGDTYSNSKIERTPPYGTDQFGYWNRGNQIDVRIPENAPEGWYSAKLQLINHETMTICDETEWMERQFEIYRQDNVSINNCSEIKLKGTCIDVKDLCWGSSDHKLCEIWVVKIDELENGQTPDVDVVEVYSGLPSTKGFHDENIQAGEKVAVYGCGNDKYVSIAAEERYYIRRISASTCQGVVSGHVYDAVTKEPISKAIVSASGFFNEGYTDDYGYYKLTSTCPLTYYNLVCIADGYESSSNLVKVQERGDAQVDFYLNATANRCNRTICQSKNGPGGLPYYRDGKLYQKFNECNCTRGECNCRGVEKESNCNGTISGHVYDAVTKKPIKSAGICDIEDKYVCNVCAVTNKTGGFALGAVPGEGGGCFFCPSTTYRLRCYSADCYKTADDNDEGAFELVTTDEKGNAYVDFYLNPKEKCLKEECKKLESYIGNPYIDEYGNKVQEKTVCKCQGCKCNCDSIEIEILEPCKGSNMPAANPLEGPSSGRIGIASTYTTSGYDRDKHGFRFEFDWDESIEKPDRIYYDGEAVSVSHVWQTTGCHEIRVRAIDVCGLPGYWSNIRKVIVTV